MGRLTQRSTSRVLQLAVEQTIGRASDCALALPKSFVSARHAEIRWNDDGWQVKDLNSRNGTFVNGERLAPGEWRTLKAGDSACFGDVAEELWELTDDGRPAPMLVPLEGGSPIAITDSLMALPQDRPEATIWEDEHRAWWIEPMDGAAVPLDFGGIVSVSGKRYRFVCDESISTTELVKRPLELAGGRLELRHSLDEEYVEAIVHAPGGVSVSLGDRQHHSVLLTLARQRLADRERGVPEGSSGWLYIEQLMRRLAVDRNQLNLHVYRLRQQLSRAGFSNAPEVVERRLQTREVRLGFREVEVVRL